MDIEIFGYLYLVKERDVDRCLSVSAKLAPGGALLFSTNIEAG